MERWWVWRRGSRRTREQRLRLRNSNTATVTGPATTAAAAPRTKRPIRAIRRDHPLGVIRSGQFRMYWTAGFLTFTAFSMQMLTRGWLMEQLTGSPFLVALVVAGMMLPMLFLSLFGGVLADRLDRRKIIVAADISTFAGFVVVTLLAVFDVLDAVAFDSDLVLERRRICIGHARPAERSLAG